MLGLLQDFVKILIDLFCSVTRLLAYTKLYLLNLYYIYSEKNKAQVDLRGNYNDFFQPRLGFRSGSWAEIATGQKVKPYMASNYGHACVLSA